MVISLDCILGKCKSNKHIIAARTIPSEMLLVVLSFSCYLTRGYKVNNYVSISNPSMERITNCCRNCLHLGRIQRQPPDSCHILDIPVLIVYTTTMAFNICK